MEKVWLTITEVSEKTNIPNDTVRRYVRFHKHFLNVRKKGNSYQVEERSIPIFKEVRRLYEEGATSSEVDERLEKTNVLTIDVLDEDQKSRSIDVATAIHELRSGFIQSINLLQKENEKLHKEIAATRELLEEYKTGHEQGMNELKHTVNDNLNKVKVKREQEVKTLNNTMNEMKESLNEVKEQKWSTLTLDEVRASMNRPEQKGWFSRLFGN